MSMSILVVEKPYEYGYFKMDKLYGCKYPIVKKLKGNIQSRHSLDIW